MTTVQFSFEELSPRDEHRRPIHGIMLYGTATLTTDDPDFDKYGFVITDVVYEGGFTAAKGWLLDQVKAEIYNETTVIGRAAHEAFREAVDDAEPVRPFMGRVYSALEVRS